MYKIEVPITINRITTLFYKLRVWDRNEGIVICSIFLKLFQATNFVSFVLSMVIRAFITTEMQEVAYLTDFSITTGAHAVLMVYIMWKKADILKFIDEIGTHSTNDNNEFVRVSSRSNAFLKFAEMIVLVCSGEVALSIIFPIFTNKSIVNIAWFWEKSGVSFWISHIFVSFGCIYSSIWFLLTVIIWYLMLNCWIKYELLGNQLQSLGKTNVKELQASSPEQHQKLFVEALIKTIKEHRKIHSTIEHFSSTFSIFFFIEIMTGSIAICSGVYNMAFNPHENLIEDIFSCGFLMFNFFNIFVLMYVGNEIELSSGRLSYWLFQSNWIEQSPTSKKCIIIMTEVLKQPHKLIIGKLYPLNLQTFTSIVNGAYSLFNILRQW